MNTRASVVFVVAITAACGARTQLDATKKTDAGNDCRITLASNADWPVYASETDANPLGVAQPVCASAAQPYCPAGALIYADGGTWGADISTLSDTGAVWIWGDVSIHDPANLAKFVFTRTFTLVGSPHGSLSIAADDYAEVKVNGNVVGSVGSITDISLAMKSQASLTTFDLTPYLKSGPNTITVIGQNGPPAFASCAGSCDYTHNPAGVVFGGSLACD